MAAYGGLVSLMHIIDNLENHPRPPICLDKNQVDLLTQKIAFLQGFLEGGYSTEADPLESRIRDAAYAAEDVIESHIVDSVIQGESRHGRKQLSSDAAVYQDLEPVIEEMALIEKEALEIKQTVSVGVIQVQHQMHSKSTPPDSSGSSASSSAAQQSEMVGADELLLQMKDKLRSDRLALQIIPIVGMGGSGKTTLARNIYQDPLVKEHFHIRAWITISQEYSVPQILQQLLKQLDHEGSQNLGELGDMLHRHLFGRKYLIILDDMWNIEAWEGVQIFLPNTNNGSKILITTRLSDLASKFPNSNTFEMKLLDDAKSWELLAKTAYGGRDCLVELEWIGKKIAKSCKGLPLAIVVVGGLLAKSNHRREFWEYIEENINSIVNLEDGERCLKILRMSYKHLPVYLKPCFLFMEVFGEDEVIRVSRLIKLWVAEGVVKPVRGKSLEEIAKEYLDDLIGRNLIMIHELSSIGNIRTCKIHDLVRDLCLREAQRDRSCTPSRRVVISSTISKKVAIDKKSRESMSVARTLMWHLEYGTPTPHNFRLLRILDVCGARYRGLGENESDKFLKCMRQLVNSRFLCYTISTERSLHDSIGLFWNLQTIICHQSAEEYLPTEIWYMPHIRHLQFRYWLSLPDPPNGQDDIVLGNLQTLGVLCSFKCSIEIAKRIPKIKKLVLQYSNLDCDRHCLWNLDCLNKLESLTLYNYFDMINASVINFPHSLKKLNLSMYEGNYWEEMLEKIGELPLLQKLQLFSGSFKEGQWETSEGQFCSLKSLAIRLCKGLQVWKTESSHFPRLEHLRLHDVEKLEEIPLEFADISTLRVIEVEFCGDPVVVSAKRILEEQEDLYGEEAALHVQVRLSDYRNHKAALERLASPNFHVR